MTLLYNQLDGIALLPISWYKKYSVNRFIFRPRCYDAEENILNKMQKIVELEYNKKESRLFTYLGENDYPLYIYYTYNLNIEGIIFVDDDIAFKEYKKRGGSFTEQELKSLTFTKLNKLKFKKLSLKEINSKIQQNPREPYLYVTRARYYENNKQYINAIKDYTTAINIDKNKYKHYFYLRAKAYLANKEYEKAEKDYIFFINSSPYSIEIRKNLIELYLHQQKYEKAIEEYKKLIEIFEYYNDNVKRTFYAGLADVQFQLGLYNDVINTVNKEEGLTKYYANYQIRALAKFKIGDFNGAYEDIKKVFEYNLEDKDSQKIIQRIQSKIKNK